MSWDVALFNFPADMTLNEVDDDYRPDPLGPASDVLATLRETFPGIDLRDPTWGFLSDDQWVIEFNIGEENPVESIMLHVRGSGDVLPTVRRAAAVLGCRAMDCSTGDFIETGGSDGWAGFQAFRDRALRNQQ